jgi:hypothetical protein
MDREGDIFMMSRKEIKRYQIIRKVLDKQVKQKEAAECLDLSSRQIRRIIKRIVVEAEAGVIHRLRGKIGNHRLKDEFKQKVLDLYIKNYWDFGPTLASEKLLERNGVRVSDETLRLWLIKDGLWHLKKRNKTKDRSRRERKDHLGQMVQMDGSHHDWLEGRGPKLVLMGYIDDATNRFHGRFYDYEGTMPAMGGLKGYIKRYGLPGSIYLDKHPTYKRTCQQRYTNWPFRDEEELTQFARACKQLGIELISAHSAQAKGRIERVFKTLQDRLVKELRLAQINTLEDANRLLDTYLPVFNRKFEVVAKAKGDFHRSVDKRTNLDDILSVQTSRFLRNDRTLTHHKQWYQVLTKTRAQWVTFHEYLDGKVAIIYDKNRLAFKSIEPPAAKVHLPVVRRFKRVRNIPKPGRSHPWKNFAKKSGHF